ncbi:Vacuolar fusion protein mon1 [Oleoguttula sp. CCFEE 5521]
MPHDEVDGGDGPNLKSPNGSPHPPHQPAFEVEQMAAPMGVVVDAESGNVEVASRESTPPPLPPRPAQLQLLDERSSPSSTNLAKRTSRPQLLSQATTAVSLTEVQLQSRSGDGTTAHSSPASRAASRRRSFTRVVTGSYMDDAMSIRSSVPTLNVPYDQVSIFGDEASPAWQALSAQIEHGDPFDAAEVYSDPVVDQIEHEFDELEKRESNGSNETSLREQWSSKLKHFFILSGSGKPVYSRHGDDQLISHYIGVALTLISFYQGANDSLKSFMAADTRFVILQKGPLNLIAVSKLGESEMQLRNQLESLYMQILSTLTLPSLERIFSNRPSTDLRRPLQGTDVLLDGLTDGFTRGSPSTLLSSLECLRLRKTHRRAINETLLKVRSPDLLYGLIVAAGRLVSVVRPKKHSLHPGDLHLIFNMLFEAGSVKTGGGENWIPLCLPGFNNTGFVYMHVSFLSATPASVQESTQTAQPASDDLAIVLISPNKDSFYSLRKMRDALLKALESSTLLSTLSKAIQAGHLGIADIAGATTPLRHFLYKSRGNVQFTMPSLVPHYRHAVARRRLMSLYGALHEALHVKTARLKVHHLVSSHATALAWETPLFELYCVAGPGTSRAALAAGANVVVQWVRREEERVFIIGGAVF